MAELSELFAADHATALTRTAALDAGDVPDTATHLELTSVGPAELEALGEIAAEVVRFGTGDLELEEVDLDHENLFELPPFLVDLLVELGRTEDEDAVAEVAERWAASDVMEATAGELTPVLSDIVDLVTTASREDLHVYLWTEPLG